MSDASNDNATLVGALDHARGMANFASEVRMRNFNFFVVIVGGLVAGHLFEDKNWAPVVLSVGGIIVSAFFFGLDLRMREILKRSIDQLQVLEPEVWKRAGITGWREIPRSGPGGVTSHKWIYRGFFVLTGLISLAVLVASVV